MILVVVLLAVVAMYARPMLSVADSWRDVAAQDQRLEEVKRDNRKLRKRHEELTTSAEEKSTLQRSGRAVGGAGSAAAEPTIAPSTNTGVEAIPGPVGGTGGSDPVVEEPDAVVVPESTPAPDAGNSAPTGGDTSGGVSVGALSG